VVTPRRGKAVEINALYYNALKLLEDWVRMEDDESGEADVLAERAARARASFNRRFWLEDEQQLYDLVDGEHGDDPSCRPNQIFAMALRYPVLDQERWRPVLEAVRRSLLTPCGLRTLHPGHPDYKPQYDGDLRARDAAYHQGTVWPWLIGPFVNAWLRTAPEDRLAARRMVCGFDAHLNQAGIGSISEIFGAEAPYSPRGCISQAWSVAEVLRALLATEDHA
jgi:predicted glycogen debranching enzyme